MPEKRKSSWWGKFGLIIAAIGCFPRPDEMGLLPSFNAEPLSQRSAYDFTLLHHDGRIILRAVPRQKDPFIGKFDVMFTPDSYEPVAQQLVWAFGDRTVHTFEEVRLNQRPSDRDRLINPVPQGYVLEQGDRLYADRMFPAKTTREGHPKQAP